MNPKGSEELKKKRTRIDRINCSMCNFEVSRTTCSKKLERCPNCGYQFPVGDCADAGIR